MTYSNIFRFRRRNSSLENLNQRLAQDGLSDKPKEDRIVKFKDEQDQEEDATASKRGREISQSNSQERGRSRTRMARGGPNKKGSSQTVSILKDPSRNRESKVKKVADEIVVPEVKKNDDDDSTSNEKTLSQEESGYDSDQMTPRSSASNSDPESPEAIVKAAKIKDKLGEVPIQHVEDDLEANGEEKDLSLESITTRNGAMVLHGDPMSAKLAKKDSFNAHAAFRVERDFSLRDPGPKSIPYEPFSSLISLPKESGMALSLPPTTKPLMKKSVREMVKQLEEANKTDEEKLMQGSCGGNIIKKGNSSQDGNNITKVEVAWSKNSEASKDAVQQQQQQDVSSIKLGEEASFQSSLVNTSLDRDDTCSVISEASTSTTVPMDFGESLPPTLAALSDMKQFRLYRLKKAEGEELGVLITKKVGGGGCGTAGYVVAYVEPGGLVDRDGRFRVGDEIINVNGKVHGTVVLKNHSTLI